MKASNLFKCITVLVFALLIMGSGIPAHAGIQDSLIPPGPSNSLPDYIGSPAKPHPTANSGIPQNPYLAPNPFNTIHVDPWMSDVYDIPGPLGYAPIVTFTRLEDARNDPNSKVFQCSGGVFDPYGNLLTSCSGTGEAGVILVNPKTLEVLDYYPLTPNTQGGENAVASVYWAYDSQGGFTFSGPVNSQFVAPRSWLPGSKVGQPIIPCLRFHRDLNTTCQASSRPAIKWPASCGIGRDGCGS